MHSQSSRTARRTHGFTESVIRGMTRLANEHGAINLAQGFPNFPAPDVLKEAATRAIRDDVNQYAITWGAKRLRDALVAASFRTSGAGKLGNPWARLIAPCSLASRVMPRITDSVKPCVRCAVCMGRRMVEGG